MNDVRYKLSYGEKSSFGFDAPMVGTTKELAELLIEIGNSLLQLEECDVVKTFRPEDIV